MKISYDPAKYARNITEREIPFELAREMGWDSAVIDEDTRKDYGER